MKRYAMTISAALLLATATVAEDFAAWTNRMTVTFSGYAGTTVLANFPALVRFDAATTARMRPDGADLRFLDAHGNLLAYDIDVWNPAGESLVWVRVPALDATTRIIACFGNNAADAPTDAARTWSDEFMLVQHFSEAGGGAAVINSTATPRMGTINGATIPGHARASGAIGLAANLSAGADCGIIVPSFHPGRDWTASVWIKNLKPNTAYRTLLRGASYHHLLFNSGTDVVGSYVGSFRAATKDGQNAVITVADTADWRLLTVAGSGANTLFYLDGEYIGSNAHNANDTFTHIGFWPGGQQFANYLDEVRVASGTRSDDWIKAEFDTVKRDNFAVCGNVEDNDQPLIAALPPLAIRGSSTTLAGHLLHAGSSGTADVTLFWGTDTASLTATNLGFMATSAFNVELTGLNCETDYFYYFTAESGSDIATSSTLSFRTPGAPVFGVPTAAAFADSIIFSVPLDPGAGLLWAKCRVSDDQASLGTVSPAQEWDAEIPATLVHTVSGLSESATRYAQFEAYSIMPDSTGVDITVWSDVVSATVSSRELVWNNAANNNTWNTTSVNWNLAGVGNTTFAHGNSARFPGNASRNLTLAEPVTAENVTVDISGGDNNVNYWALSGAKPLSLYGVFTIRDSNNNVNNRIDEPVLLGPGNVRLESGRFRLGNSANQFTGGVNVLGGQLDATVTGANASPLGSGSVVLGSADVSATSSATLSLNAANAAAIHLPALTLDGAMNAAKLALTGAGPLDASFNGFARVPGATLQVNATANSTLSIANIGADDLLPPWVAATSGHYMQNNDGVLSAITDYAGYGIFTGSSLTASTNVTAARLTANLNLGGNTLSLGGAILGNNITVSGGTLDLTGDNAYLYVPSGAATLSTLFSGDGLLTKFGTGVLRLTGGQDPDIVNQEGTLTLMPPAAMTYQGDLSGAGSYQIRSNITTLPREEYTFNNLRLQSGGLTIGEGTRVMHYGQFISGAQSDGVNASDGSILTLRDGARWTQAVANNFHVGMANGDGWRAYNHQLLVTGAASDGTPSTLDLNRSLLILSHMAMGDKSHTGTNTITITSGAVVTNAASVRVANNQGGNTSQIILSGGARLYTALTEIAIGGGGNNNTVTITGANTSWDNGNGAFNIGNTGGGTSANNNKVIVTGHAVLANVNSLNIGYRGGDRGASANGNAVIVSNHAHIVLSGGNVAIGNGTAGSAVNNNSLVLAGNGAITVPNAITVGTSATSSSGNALVLAGGSGSASSLSVTSSNRLDLVLGSAGLKPLQLTGNATFTTGSYITPLCTDKTMAGYYYPVITTTAGTISTNGVIFNPSQPNLTFKLVLSEDRKELALGVFPQGVLLILR